MRTLITTTAAALMLAAPLAAATPAELAKQHFAQSHDSGDGARYDAGFTASATGATTDLARIHFAGEGEEGDLRILSNVDSGMVVSTSNASSDTAAFARAHFAQSDNRGDDNS